MKTIPRLITAMVTPFNSDLSVNYEAAQKLALKLIKDGSEGIVVCGTTGESPTLSIPEKMDLFKAVKEAVGDQGYVIAGTGTNSTDDCLKLTEAATKTRVDGLLIVVPYYNKPNAEGMYRHFAAAAGVTDLPVIMYNVPGRTGINIQPEIVARLSQLPNIVAIKESSGNLDQVSCIRSLVADDFLIFSGDDNLTLPILAVGGYGVISVASHLAAPQIKQMIDSFVSGDIQKAREIHIRLFDLFRAMFITSNPIPVKTAMNLTGYEVGGLRLPLAEATPEETAKIKAVMQKLSLIQ